MATNPILSEIQGLSPGAQAALGMAGHALSQGAANPAPPMNAPVVTPQMKAQPQDAGPAPTLAPIKMPGTDSVPSMGGAPEPNIHVLGSSPLGTLQGDKDELQRKLTTGSGESQIMHRIEGTGFGQAHPMFGKILGGAAQGAATLGDIGLSAVAPGLAANIPGTAYHHMEDVNRENKQVASDEGNAKKEAQTSNLELQPQLKQAQGVLAQEKQDEVESQHQAINQNNADKMKSTLAQHGFAEDEQHPGQLRPLRYEEMSESQQAVHDLSASRSELADATAAYKKAQTSGIPAQMHMAQERINNAQHNAAIAEQRLGLQSERLNFQEDRNYNPQPTASQRKTGDLAGSAIEQVHTMRSILAAHPEFAGPGGGAHQAFQRWLSSDGEDAGRFLAASNYLADHSAATFGGRGAYITQQLHGLTNPNFSPSTLNGVLDQAEETAGRFATAGKTHNKAGTLQPLQSQQPEATPARPSGVPANYQWNAQGNGGKGSWRSPQ